jgi:hypothetical protein
MSLLTEETTHKHDYIATERERNRDEAQQGSDSAHTMMVPVTHPSTTMRDAPARVQVIDKKRQRKHNIGC